MFARTERLLLRPGWPEDAPALARAIGHEAVAMRLARVPWPYGEADAAAWLRQPPAPGEIRLVIVARDRARPALIGGIGLVPRAAEHELGYWLTPAEWGKGYATEAGRAVLAMARATLGMRRLTSGHFVDNPASGRVLHKLGFRPTGRDRRHSLARGGEGDRVALALDPETAPARLAA